jgi:hypothetical protein
VLLTIATSEAEAGRSRVQGQPGHHSKIFIKSTNKQTTTRKSQTYRESCSSCLGVLECACVPVTWEAEAGGGLVPSTGVQSWPEQHTEALSLKM